MSWYLGKQGEENKIPTPNEFRIGPEKILRRDRTASGKLVADTIATKKTFELSYTAIDESDTETLLNLHDQNEFLSFLYPDRGETMQATVWFSEFPREKLISPQNYWGNITITLEER